MSEFTERMEQARADMMSTIRATDKQIAAIYDQAAKDLAHKAAGQKDGSLTKRWQLDMSQSLTERMNQLNGSVTNTVIASATTASRLPGNANADWLDLVLARSGAKIGGDSFRSVLTRTSDEALRQVVTGKAYLDSKSLSRRIWNNTVRGREAINEILQQGIAKKQSAYEMAKLLERYVNPKAWEDYDWRKVYPDMPSWLSGRWTSVEKHAQNVARTTINHAYHLSVVEAAKANPFTDAIHWELSPQHWERQVRPFGMDICDDYSMHNEGLGIGNFPVNAVPLPHAGCLCVQYAVVGKPLDQCASELKDWLQGGSNQTMDAAFGEWKKGLNSISISGTTPPITQQPTQPQQAQAQTPAPPQPVQPPAQAQGQSTARTALLKKVEQQAWAQSLQDTDRGAILQALGKTTDNDLTFFAAKSDQIQGQFYGTGTSAYYQNRRVTMNIGRRDDRSVAIGYPDTDVRVFFHEVGHLMDYQAFTGTMLRHELGSGYRDALERDLLKHANKVLTAAKEPTITTTARVSAMQKAVINRDMMIDPHIKNAVSDISGGLTNGRLEGLYGHPTSYWQVQDASVEAVAHMYEARMVGGAKYAAMQEYYPEAFKLYNDAFDKLAAAELTGGGSP